ncbi:Asp-tRNA(Asn)/Glu-tRNA(Gln) amidotransferase subunit GatC [Natranaerofaba carboxydovora]|uniref:Asp-tRNA(Asn)/Glu-tRNA(Gln) amidotransferase subunit GatC n=1 Tax=Natranaerofaba carboxydovora TaxID=2742683 RepID=UPI001F133F42|nr:Asp-tRNA(Asn)/Glu-tRNA(Gln) amidotransferase subunit GatC [Natranaerofaba carboxydovora]UMZ74532.1 Aspartyl/glutamyl-tRNA(Asn/Gln) amidotransferase subunit C [Natranaerofaba carboxydovora]
MKVDKDIVRHVADLGRLYVKDEDVDAFAEQLGEVLKWADKLQELDLDGVEPTAHALDMKNVFRNDERRESLSTEKALENAPDKEDGYFKVPRIIEE